MNGNKQRNPLPKVICSSVIRSAHQGESHGGMYIVNLKSGKCDQVINYNDGGINWSGRGGERGLRGIALHKNEVYLAASNKVIVYDQNFKQIAVLKNRYINQCHEIYIHGKSLFITSTSFNSIIEYNLDNKTFVKGYFLKRINNEKRIGKTVFFSRLKGLFKKTNIILETFDPNMEKGPDAVDTIHINNVYYFNDTLYVSGTGLSSFLCIKNDNLTFFAKLPSGNHNARPFAKGVLLNDTASNIVSYIDYKGNIIESFPIKIYKEGSLINSGLPKDYARQGFARGLCVTSDGLIIAGSSPATISAYKLGIPNPIKVVNLTMDIRNSIHGLESWPF